MIITCEECKTNFRIDEAKVKPEGSKVRCSKCGNVFPIHKHVAEPESLTLDTPGSPQVREPSLSEPSQSGEAGKVVPVSPTNKDSLNITSDDMFDHSSTEAFSDEPIVPQSKPANPPGGQNTQDLQFSESGAEKTKGPTTMMLATIDSSSQSGASSDPGDFDWENLDMSQELGSERDQLQAPTGHVQSPEQMDFADALEGQSFEAELDPGLEPEPRPTNAGDFQYDEQDELNELPDFPEDVADEPSESGPSLGHPDLGESDSLEIDTDPGEPSTRYQDLVQPDRALTELNATRGEQTFIDDSLTSAPSRVKQPDYYPRKSVGMGILRTVFITFFALIVLAAIVIAVSMFGSNFGVLKSDQLAKFGGLLKSLVPIKFSDPALDKVLVLEEEGRWLRTRNGYMFVISGTVVNDSNYIINFIEVESEFVSSGEMLFSHIAFAGNTFSNQELKTLTIEEIYDRLNRKNGDIDFKNTDKLAGLNYGINPGETVPFFTMFPSESKILGLRYRVKVSGFERGPVVDRR